jgi:NADPH2:quinone reductase
MTGKREGIPDGIPWNTRTAGEVKGPQDDIGYLCSKYFINGLEEGWFRGQRQEECPDGMEGIEGALKRWKDGSANAVKFFFKIADTTDTGSGR